MKPEYKICLGCGMKFFAPTKRAKFCSADCRVFYNREKKRKKKDPRYKIRIREK